MKIKKIAALCSAFVVALSAGTIGVTKYTLSEKAERVSAAANLNYVEALQKSLFFYEVQQSGPLADWNSVTWRADATMHDEVLGGWYDAGDHVKFNLPMAFSAGMLNWAFIQYGDGLNAYPQLRQRYQLNVQYALDYLVDCDRGDSIVYQIGDGQADHKWWGSPEIIELEMKRPFYTAKNASCVEGEMAAALASGYIAMKKDYPDKAAVYLEKAKHYFELADKYRSDADYTEANDYYKSWSGFWDELFYSANWLYMATGDKTYLDKATNEYLPKLSEENQTNGQKSFSWPHCWDDVAQGGYVLYAQNTGDAEWVEQVKKHLQWMQGETVTMINGGTKAGAGALADGLALTGDQWATLRYANNAAFIANVAVDTLDFDAAFETKTIAFAKKQADYVLGDNANGFSYMIGYGTKYSQHPHHRAAYGDWLDSNAKNPYHDANGFSHLLYGAVVGGPDKSGKYEDTPSNYEMNEVATDYNAAFTGNILKLIGEYGGAFDAAFPPAETPTRNEIYVEAGMNGQGNFFTPIVIAAKNHSSWPARVLETPTFRYFIDLTEVFDAGYTANDVFTKIDYERYSSGKDSNGLTVSPVQISAHPVQYSGNIYYIELKYPNSPSVFAPMGQEQHSLEIQFRFGLPDGSKSGSWNPDNDYSYSSVKSGSKEKPALCDNICIYDDDVLIWGIEPDGKAPVVTDPTPGTLPGGSGTTAKPSTTTTTATTTTPTKVSTLTTTRITPITTTGTSASSSTTTKSSVTTAPIDPSAFYGDVDENKFVGLNDIVMFAKYLGGNLKLSDQALKNAKCDRSSNSLNVLDLIAIIKFVFGEVESLPL